MAKAQVVKFELNPEATELKLFWSDGATTQHSGDVLRKECPCANCKVEREKLAGQKKNALRVIQGPAIEKARIEDIKPVGRYALAFKWNDGHQTGIYSFEYLRGDGVH
jgi:DUF971 family protein